MNACRLNNLTKTGLGTELGKVIQREVPVGGCLQTK